MESMIVLGVTGVLFLSLAMMVSGQQGKARFKAAMTDITTQIQSQINQVATGYYPSMGDFRCVAAGNVILLTAATQELGSNKGCTFLGSAMMYGIPSTDPEEYRIHTLVGLQRTPTGDEPTTIRETALRVVAPGIASSTYNPPTTPDRSTVKMLQYGTTVAWMCSVNGGSGCSGGGGENIVGFAIVAAPNQQVQVDQNGSVESGSIIPMIIPIPHNGIATSPGAAPTTGVELIVRSLGQAVPNITAEPTDGPIKICFRSGTTDQSGLVTIGESGSTTSVDFTIHQNTNCS